MHTTPSTAPGRQYGPFKKPSQNPNFSPPPIRSLLVRQADSENLERGEEKLERGEWDTLDRSTSAGIRASKTPARPRDCGTSWRRQSPQRQPEPPARRLYRGNCSETVCVKTNCTERLYRGSRVEYGTGRKPLRTAQLPPISRAGFESGRVRYGVRTIKLSAASPPLS